MGIEQKWIDFLEDLNKTDSFEDLGIGGSIILK